MAEQIPDPSGLQNPGIVNSTCDVPFICSYNPSIVEDGCAINNSKREFSFLIREISELNQPQGLNIHILPSIYISNQEDYLQILSTGIYFLSVVSSEWQVLLCSFFPSCALLLHTGEFVPCYSFFNVYPLCRKPEN